MLFIQILGQFNLGTGIIIFNFAIIESGGNQYRVSEGNTINVEKIEANDGDKIVLDHVLFLYDDKNDNTLIGKPALDNVKVEAEVVKTYKDKKVIIFKKRRRHASQRKNGHRQTKTMLKITGIKVS